MRTHIVLSRCAKWLSIAAQVFRSKGSTVSVGFGLLLILGAGCTTEGTFRLQVIFADDALRESVNQVELFVIDRGTNACEQWMTGELTPEKLNLYLHQMVELSEGAERRTTPIPAQALFFLVEGRDDDDTLFLRGCSAATTLAGETIDVTVTIQVYCRAIEGGEVVGNGIDDDCDGLTDE